MESLVQTLQSLPPWGVLGMLFAFAFIENIFPPSPSDLVTVAGGTLVGIGTVGFIPAVLVSTAGSILGFLVAFVVGRVFGRRIVEAHRIKWISIDAVHRVESWFRKYGYAIIVVNRFLSGTRAVVSFVAGMAEMRTVPTAVLCGVSALVWNGLLLWGGAELGQNWQKIEIYLEQYSKIVTAVVLCIVAILVIRAIRNRQRLTPQ